MNKRPSILISNSFPFALIRRKVTVTPVPLSTLCNILHSCDIVSAWGHANTLELANEIVGAELTPQSDRPVITLTEEYFPSLAGRTFTECWLLSPDYTQGFRPKIGEEVPPEAIAGWQVLLLKWE